MYLGEQMALNDNEIRASNSISPFKDHNYEKGKISSGLGSFGYDITLAPSLELFVGGIIDPKDFKLLRQKLPVFEDHFGRFVILPAHSFALGHSVEHFSIPEDVIVLCVGKSTYARCGLIVNITPLEPGWKGIITLEISNTTPCAAKVYVDEGIAQAIFFKGNRPEVTYSDKKGKYQNQTGITLPKIVTPNDDIPSSDSLGDPDE